MRLNREFREDYERRFNGYIMRIIKNEYIRWSKKEKERQKVISLNITTDIETELIEELIGDNDISVKESLAPNELELIFEDARVYRAVKSLTYKEKLAIFLCFILELDKNQVAKIMGFSSQQSVYKICERAISKIKERVELEND